MAKPKVLILRAPGTNCDSESAHAFELAGGIAEPWHINRVLDDPQRVDDYQILCIPGGFSYGDDIAAGRILGNQIQHHLADTLSKFRESGRLIIGICNGFQILLKTNLLAAGDNQGPTATLTLNDSGKFEARWIRLAIAPGNCVFLQGVEAMDLPVAHGEGKFVTRNEEVFRRMSERGQLVARYDRVTLDQSPSKNSVSEPATLQMQREYASAVPYPSNPNGAWGDVAGMSDETGRVFGLMPHPERFVEWTQHPRWTREPEREPDGLRVFQNAVRYFL